LIARHASLSVREETIGVLLEITPWKESRVMLVLTRMLDESIIIGGNTRIKILAIRGNHVRLGIAAPSRIAVIREELLGRGRTPADDTPAADGPAGNAGGSSVDERDGCPSG
jgi:carbon storage regulator